MALIRNALVHKATHITIWFSLRRTLPGDVRNGAAAELAQFHYLEKLLQLRHRLLPGHKREISPSGFMPARHYRWAADLRTSSRLSHMAKERMFPEKPPWLQIAPQTPQPILQYASATPDKEIQRNGGLCFNISQFVHHYGQAAMWEWQQTRECLAVLYHYSDRVWEILRRSSQKKKLTQRSQAAP
jgi:hypothetical protein